MKKLNKILFVISLFGLFTLNVNAQVVETTDNYTEDKFIIGRTRFDNSEIITAQKVIGATKNETKLNVALGMTLDEALKQEIKVYSYSKIFDEWYVQNDDKMVLITEEEEIKDIEENLDIFFVNNEEKVLEFEYEGNVTEVSNGVTYKDGKFTVPATTFTFEFKEDGESHVVYTEAESKTDDELNYGSFEVVEKANVVATVGTIQFDNLQDALIASTTENPAKLLKDLTVDKIIELKENETYNVLDLNGYTLTSTASEVIMINGDNNTLKITNGNIVSSNGATLYVGDKTQDGNYNKLIVDKNVKITAEKYGIYVVGDKSELDFNGELVMSGEGNAISGNGNATSANTIITIGENAKVTATDEKGFAFYLPQAGSVTINGGTFEADTVVGIKAGTLTINGGTFKATGANAKPEGWSNGIYATGDVILIEDNKDYADNMVITIAKDATLTSANGYLIQEFLHSGTNNATVKGKYETINKIEDELAVYYTSTEDAVLEFNGYKYADQALLEEFINNSTEENPVKLLKDVTVSEIIEVNGNATSNVLDLGGKKLTSTAEEVLMVNGVNNTLTLTNGNIVSSNSATLYVGTKEQNDNYNKLIVDKSVKMTADKYGIYVVGDNSELDFNGELTTTAESGAAILGSGNTPCANTIIKIGEDAKITAKAFAFYLPQSGTVTINGGTFEADTVIGIKSGELTINGGTFKATGNKVVPEGYNNGINATGDVIIIEENEGYADNINIIVTEDATLTSENGYAIQEYLYSGTNRAIVTGKYAAVNKIDTGFYYTETSKAQAEVAGAVYANLQEALNNATKGETVKVLNDITYENCSSVPLNYQTTTDNISAVLDLNGKTVSATLNNGKSIALLRVGNQNPDRNPGTATLTIQDSSESKKGTLTTQPTVESDGWTVAVETVLVERLGRLTVNSGNIITKSSELVSGGNPYGILVLTNTGPQTAELTINGGYIESKSPSGMGVRVAANSMTGAVKFTMNGGEIVGADNGRGIWFQHMAGNGKYQLIEATINGGKITADRALELGDFNLDEVVSENIQIEINGGEFNSANTNGNTSHPDCDDFFTGKSATYYNQTFNHVKLTDNR